MIDPRIMIPHAGSEIAEENCNLEQRAAPGAIFGAGIELAHAVADSSTNQIGASESDARDPDLAEVIDRWSVLPEVVRLAVMAIVRSVAK